MFRITGNISGICVLAAVRFFCVPATGYCVLLMPAFADVPHLIRYQGTAVDTQGVPLEGPYTLTFQLYGAETGGTTIWKETQANVPLTQGHFSVLLGSVTALSSLDWAAPCWLSVLVNGEELLPRQPITSVPLAITAERLATPVTTSTITDDANNLVPTGGILLWDGTACPDGYMRLSSYDDRFLVSSAVAGTTGGSNSHAHHGATEHHTLTIAEMPSHNHPLASDACGSGDMPTLNPSNTPNADESVGCQTTGATGGGNGHAHPIASVDSRPAFTTILLCKKN